MCMAERQLKGGHAGAMTRMAGGKSQDDLSLNAIEDLREAFDWDERRLQELGNSVDA